MADQGSIHVERLISNAVAGGGVAGIPGKTGDSGVEVDCEVILIPITPTNPPPY